MLSVNFMLQYNFNAPFKLHVSDRLIHVGLLYMYHTTFMNSLNFMTSGNFNVEC